MALLQMRLEQKTTVCADFAKAMHKTKAEFGKRQVHDILLTRRAVQAFSSPGSIHTQKV